MTYTLNQIVSHYRSNYSEYDIYMQHCMKQDIDNAIRYAAMGISSGTERKKGNLEKHQWRIKAETLKALGDALVLRKIEITRVTDFEQLYKIVLEEVSKIYGVGELVAYDTASRIGAKLNKLPEKIYVHAGVRTGLRNLLDRKRLPQTLDPLPEFEKYGLKPHQMENILCIYKDCFPGGDSSKCPLNPLAKKSRIC